MAGWARAAKAVAATTKGSKADKTWEESLLLVAASEMAAVGVLFIPKERSDAWPSLLCDPTRPRNGEVEQACTPLLNFLFFWIEKPKNGEGEGLAVKMKGLELGSGEKRIGFLAMEEDERQRDGTEIIEREGGEEEEEEREVNIATPEQIAGMLDRY